MSSSNAMTSTDSKCKGWRRNMTYCALFTTVFVIALSTIAHALPPCFVSLASNSSYQPFVDVMGCLQSIPFDAAQAEATITSIQRWLQLYAFLDIAANPPDPVHFESVDVMALLEDIRSRTWDSDFDFQYAIRAALSRLRDAHTQAFPAPHSAFNWMLPINLIHYNGIVEVSPVFAADIEAVVDMREYAGATVKTIDGVNAATYIAEWSFQHVGLSKDPQTRFNMAFTINNGGFIQFPFRGPRQWLGLFSWRVPFLQSPPTEPSHTFVFQFPNGTISPPTALPWFARSNLAHYPDDVGPLGTPTGIPQNARLLVANAENSVAFYQLYNDTLVWFQSTMSPPHRPSFWNAAQKALNIAAARKLTSLVIDLTANPGGEICLARALAQLLLHSNTGVFTPTDVPNSEFATAIAEAAARAPLGTAPGSWSPSEYQTYSGGQYFSTNSTDWLTDGPFHFRGGHQRQCSQLLEISNLTKGSEGASCGVPLFVSPIKFEKIVIVTRGICGSAAAFFSHLMVSYGNVSTLVVGGNKGSGSEMQWASYPGVQALFHEAAVQQFSEVGFHLPTNCSLSSFLPCPMPQGLQLSFCNREMYSRPESTAVPTEYLWSPATWHVADSRDTALFPNQAWSIARRLSQHGKPLKNHLPFQ
eukprot:TRINITY_DN2193_c0_g1_i1.p1 TRINITY_DN2193_c0_g1~~TRINITY_DN2193_c0_g1_i1.p1  ORF type:complete len:644 (+),score=56.40 TRINITY_DN2193_c0_g1_i1:2043-3974(+)